jgi:hypothetical protein
VDGAGADHGDGDSGGRLWASGEYLLWWIRNAPSNVLVEFTSPTGGSLDLVGGPHDIDTESQSGIRITAGGWLDSSGTLGLEGSYFVLGARTNHFHFSGDGGPNSPILSIPLSSNVPTLGLANFAVSFPTQTFPGVAGFPGFVIPGQAGSVDVTMRSTFDGAELNALLGLCHTGCSRAELIAGFRYLRLDEELRMSTATLALADGTINSIGDDYKTANRFYGGQVGGRFSFSQGHLFGGLTAKVGVGDNDASVTTLGRTAISTPATAVTPATTTVSSSGLFTQPGNLGHFGHSETSVIFEIGLNVGYQVVSGVRVFAGYNFLFWGSVLRPADQIDGINPFFVPALGLGTAPGAVIPPQRAAIPFTDSQFWAQGLNAGIEIRF